MHKEFITYVKEAVNEVKEMQDSDELIDVTVVVECAGVVTEFKLYQTNVGKQILELAKCSYERILEGEEVKKK